MCVVMIITNLCDTCCFVPTTDMGTDRGVLFMIQSSTEYQSTSAATLIIPPISRYLLLSVSGVRYCYPSSYSSDSTPTAISGG